MLTPISKEVIVREFSEDYPTLALLCIEKIDKAKFSVVIEHLGH
jgi:hypothetical protein